MLEVNGLCVAYGRTQVLHGASICAERAMITTLVGPNGCGKSTLLRAIAGVLTPCGGEVLLDGEPLLGMKSSLRAQKIAYLAQGRNVPDITVGQMVLNGRFPYLSYPRRYRPEDVVIARSAMERMGISELADLPLSQLSGGMRQKVYLAMALCQQAGVIMLDEPATYLDISEQLRLDRILRSLADEGRTVLTVSHDIAGALKNSDRIAVMQDGVVRISGSVPEILESGIVTEVFGVDILSAEHDGEREFFCRPRER